MKTGIVLAFSALAALGGSGVLASIHLPFVSDGYTPPAQCTAWYDGCNMCQRDENGITTCTSRVCASPGKGFCEESATSTQSS